MVWPGWENQQLDRPNIEIGHDILKQQETGKVDSYIRTTKTKHITTMVEEIINICILPQYTYHKTVISTEIISYHRMKHPYIKLIFLLLVETLHVNQKFVSTWDNGLTEEHCDFFGYLFQQQYKPHLCYTLSSIKNAW